MVRGSSSKTLLSVGEAWLGRRPDTAKVAGSNPAEPIYAKVNDLGAIKTSPP